MNITKKQVAMLRTAQRKVGMEDADYRAMLQRIAGVRSTKDVHRDDFKTLLGEFETKGFTRRDPKGRERPPARQLGWRAGRASPDQVTYIRDLWSSFTDGEGDDRSLGKWLERTFGVSDVAFVGYGQGQKVIAALRAMLARKGGGQAA